MFFALVIVGAVLFLFVLVYFKINGDTNLITFLKSLANCWGIFIIMSLLGYSLVAIPMAHWRTTDLNVQMKYCE